ncbi:MAG TPA: PAS domain S-box protein [Ktedonobacteraceae bacterium]|nr:PAS domain S-box protein [Ktedonobacteraceae bacterium]
MSIEVSAHSDRCFRILIEHSTDAIALLTPEGTVTYASPSIERVLGYMPQECMAINGFDIIHPGDIPTIAHTFQQLLAIPGLTDTKQFRCRHKDGTWRWIEAIMTNLFHDPDVQAMVTNLHDITKQKQAEVSEQRFHLLADSAPVMIWTSDIDKLCTYFNAPWLAFTGRTIEQELGNGWAEGVHPNDMQRCLDIYTSSFDARKPFSMDYRLRRFDGQYRWVLDNGIPFYTPDGTFTGYIGSCIDITERRELEQQLQYSERKLRTLMESNILGVAVSDSAGRIHEVNDQFAQLVGYSKEELLSGAVTKDQLIPEDYREVLTQHEEILLSTGAMPPWEKECLRKDGSRVPTSMAGALIDRERGLALLLFHDNSHRKEVERRKQEFLGMVSHELRTPLTAILGLIELVLMQIELRPRSLAPEAEGLLCQIEKALKRASGQVEIETRLVEELLEVSRLEMHRFELSLQRENLVTIVQETVANQQLAACTHQIELALPLDEEVPVMVDAGRIGQVLTNYLVNAFKYTPVDQVVCVRLEITGTVARVSVHDQGPGLTLEQQQRVWERFYQATPGDQAGDGGLGLGLAIAKSIIEQHHGQVGVESVPGLGSTFWFTVPLADGLSQA